MKTSWLAKTIGLSLLLSASLRAHGDSFYAFQAARMKAAQITDNPAGVHCELRFTDGKSRFQQGETIRVTLAFWDEQPGRYLLNRYFNNLRNPLNSENFVVTPGEGVVNPLGDLPLILAENINGNVPLPAPLTTKPTEITLDLNYYLRFDRPGKYQLFFKTASLLDDTPVNREGHMAYFIGPILTSTAAQLEIVPADPKWAHEQVEEQQRIWRSTRFNDTPPLPKNDLRYIGTQEAAQAIIERLSEKEDPNHERYEWDNALVGFRDREWLIEAMNNALLRPDYAVKPASIDILSLLEALEQKSEGELVPQVAPSVDDSGIVRNSPIEADLYNRKKAARRILYQTLLNALPRKTERAQMISQSTLAKEE